MKRTMLSVVLWSLATVAAAGDFPLTWVRSIDGTGDGIGGAAGTPLLRAAPADYSGNGSGNMINEPPHVPNARTVSNVVADQPNLLPNDRDLSDMVWAWGSSSTTISI